MHRHAALVVVFAGLAACAELKSSHETPDGGQVGAPPSDPSDAQAPSTLDGGDGADAGPGVGPGAECRPLALPCLDPMLASVIEVPSEMTLDQAFAAAKTGDVVQVRGLALGAGWRVPAYVTLHGCDGARIDGAIGFKGSGGTVEGFTVKGSIVANATGSFVVRSNHFVAGGTPSEAGVSGRAIDGIVGAQVQLVVDANLFEGRDRGVEAATSYDTQTRTVDITVRNNVFAGVAQPVVVSEGGLVGVINAKIEQNTFFAFATAVSLVAVDRRTTLSGDLFVQGDTGVTGSPYDIAYSLAWNVTTPSGTPPVSGTIAVGDPKLVDADAGDLRLGAGSAAIDRIPNGVSVPNEDFRGCPRPAGANGALPQADIGALEAQP